MKLPTSLIGFLTIVSLLSSCKCDDITCMGLDQQHAAWLPYKPGDTIKYQNNTGQEIHFTVNRYSVLPTQDLDCGPDGFGGCKCPECPTPNGQSFAETKDSLRKIVNQQGQTVQIYRSLYSYVVKPKMNEDSVHLSYYIFDHFNKVTTWPALKLYGNDILLPSFSAGSNNYTEVIYHESDTTRPVAPNPIYNVYFVWKSWYTKQHGVVAFYDLKTRSLFYRK